MERKTKHEAKTLKLISGQHPTLTNTLLMFQDFKAFFRISRPTNVVMSFLAFGLSCYLATNSINFLLDSAFWGTALTITVIAASGYWINDVYDFRIDRINKPEKAVVNAILSVKKVLTVYFIANMLVLAFSFLFLGIYHEKPNITFINFVSVFCLFIYASYLKRMGVIGNLLISFMIALVLILAYYLTGQINMALVWAIVFSFEITLIREVTKDVQDIKGDLAFQVRTLIIQVGMKRTKQFLTLLYSLFILSTWLPFFYYYFVYDLQKWTYLGLSILLVQLPAVWIMRMMLKEEVPEDFGKQSSLLKYVMLTGMGTLFFMG
ncbi:MAG: geranylgeranylglycerol-phosphate geranylgeranyltransferase [Bacteroidia bacterium]|nr:geranylgeranylglycerol-phosphate geranylgeranyltransferase [Bacteroidia bacterium]